MDYKKSRWILVVATILAIASCLIYYFKPDLDFRAGVNIGLVIAVIGLVQYFIFYRCPFCKKSLAAKQKYCPHCGGRLE